MKANPNRFWAIVILLGWLFDFLFWKKPVGVNFALFVALSIATGMLLLRMDGLRLAPRSSLLLVPIALLTAMTFVRLEPLTMFLSVCMALFLMGLFSLTYLSGRWTRYRVVDYILGYLRLLGSVIARPLGFISENRPTQPSSEGKRGQMLWPVLRGIVIALPVLAIFAYLLSEADPIFARRLGDLIDLFNIENLPEYIFRLVYILVIAYILAGIYLHAAQKSAEAVEEKTWVSPFLGFTESAIVLGSVAILFAAFVIIQFQYFFGGQANISMEGYTYSEYARKGFGELVAVAFISLLLLLGLGAITHRESNTQRRTFSSLGIVLVGLVIVMLFSAYQRLVLYETAYGFSRLRTYTHVFMIWLGLLLVTVVVLEATHRERAVGLAILLTALGFIASLGLLNVDAFIVERNIQREIQSSEAKATSWDGEPLDAQYFLNLSDDAVPPLVAAYQNQALPDLVREEVGASLACIRYSREQDARPLPWQSFHFSRYAADQAIKTVDKDLDSFKVKDEERPVTVITPAGQEFSCMQFSGD
jgi:hypothetical protein